MEAFVLSDVFESLYGVNLPADDERLDQRIPLHWEPVIELDDEGAKVVFLD